DPLPLDLAAGAPQAAEAALVYLAEGATRCMRRELDALVTAPVNKQSILRTGRRFIGQTELLSELAGANRTSMMLLGDDPYGRWIRVTLATTHIPLRDVAFELSQAKIEKAIELTSQACAQLGLARARIGVCGLNPHAGEGGKLGTEELSIIEPAVEAMRKNN